MKKQLKKKWIDSLRSGSYKQGSSYLRDKNDCYCCLGVLCDISGCEWVESRTSDIKKVKIVIGDQEHWATGYFSQSLSEHFGLTQQQSMELSYLNDGVFAKPLSFNQIADWIQENVNAE